MIAAHCNRTTLILICLFFFFKCKQVAHFPHVFINVSEAKCADYIHCYCYCIFTTDEVPVVVFFPVSCQLLCRMKRLAGAVSEDAFHAALQDLQTSQEWLQSTSLHDWFHGTWLAEKKVCVTFFVTFCLSSACNLKTCMRNTVSICVVVIVLFQSSNALT